VVDKHILKTVGELRKLLEEMPDEMPVQFSPITMSYLGGYPLRPVEIRVFKDSGWSRGKPGDEGAFCNVYVYEDESEEDDEFDSDVTVVL
jgi:hypothetical protein